MEHLVDILRGIMVYVTNTDTNSQRQGSCVQDNITEVYEKFNQDKIPIDKPKMSVNEGRLDTRQRVRLAKAISLPNMETIALGYMGFEEEEIKSLTDEHKGKADRINRDILQKWCYKNAGDTQTKVSCE